MIPDSNLPVLPLPRTWRLEPAAVADMIHLADPDEIGIGMMVGFLGRGIIARVYRVPNRADQAYPHRGRQRAWAFEWAEAERIEAEAFRAGLAFVGIVHTHRHAQSKPSTLDWRRPRARDVAAIYHCRSGLLTFYTRPTVRRKGEILGRVRLAYDAPTAAYMAQFDPAGDVDPDSVPATCRVDTGPAEPRS